MHLLFDIGKTKIRLAGTKDMVSFSEPKIFDTPTGYEDLMTLLHHAGKEIAGEEQIEGAAGGIGAPFNKQDGTLYAIRNFPGWEGKPVREDLSRAFGAEVRLENDSAVVGLGEAAHGAGKGYPVMTYITISTGVGGVRIVDGRIDRAVEGFEPGWSVLALDPSSEKKYAADFLGGRAMEHETGKKPFETTDPGVWEEKARILAHLLNNVAVFWSPDAIVVGGSMMKEIGIHLDRAEFYLKDILKIFPNPPVLKKAELGDIGGIWGAMELAKK